MQRKVILIVFLCLFQIACGSEIDNEELEENAFANEETQNFELSEVEHLQENDASTECCERPYFKLSAELIYLKPSLDQASYVISSSNNIVNGEFFPHGKRHNNTSSYKPGFRIEAQYEPCQSANALDFRFTYLNSSNSDSTSGRFLFDTIGFPGDGAQAPEDINYAGKAHIRDNYRYHSLDATFNRLALDSCLDNLFLLMGLHYAHVGHTTHFKSRGVFPDHSVTKPVNNRLKSHSDFWGIGPQFGLEYTYNLTSPSCCFGRLALNTNLRASILCSQSNASFHYKTLRTAGSKGIKLRNDDLWRVNPAFDAKIGANYTLLLCNFEATVELGYEWLWYHHSVDSITGIDVAFAGDSIDLYSNLSLHGPFLRVNIAF
ncbi:MULTISPECIES: Lpg1974 family pore-forming outer membrane protein [Parachlamydia]|uniref:MOMP-like family protein n=2 Tax=Parachlamydia acanthamoebae TaxID=83552 RepID=F8KZB0_PARAV|nr:Lpg1974 family pore-forming outer membrane protein [Parachlamydia acanthamoebae]EFB41875.1 hypothetical protein pah_c022o178 [Parachlamydia acanthamoebae str. Hall's coccus]KIA78024.1 MOMP-like family protein [Parachlamydia acanthamoebae]CCB86245.1 mOMP-like family protein [Parachlamydia acanthamoebae UV-7]